MKRMNLSLARAAALSLIITGLVVSGDLSSSARSAAGRAKDCDIGGSLKSLEDCPSQTIIEQYKKEYDVEIALRGGIYWEVVTGEYVNENYGYTVTLPAGAEALCSPPPSPWHGFFIDVANELKPPADESENHGSFTWANWNVGLSVEAYYNAAEYASVGDLVNYHLESYEEHAKDFLLLERKRMSLRGMPAIHYRVQFTDDNTGETVMSDQIAAIRNKGIIYEMGLVTTASRYGEDVKLLKEIRKGFRLIPYDE